MEKPNFNTNESKEKIENIKDRVFEEAKFHRKSYFQADHLKRGPDFDIDKLKHDPSFLKMLDEVVPDYSQKHDRFNQIIGLLADKGLELYELNFDNIEDNSETKLENKNERMRIILNKIADYLSLLVNLEENHDEFRSEPSEFEITDSVLKDNIGYNILTVKGGGIQYAVVADDGLNFGTIRLTAEKPQKIYKPRVRLSEEEIRPALMKMRSSENQEYIRNQNAWYKKINEVVDFHKIDENTASIIVSFEDGTKKESVVRLDKKFTPEMEKESLNIKIKLLKRSINNIDNSGQ